MLKYYIKFFSIFDLWIPALSITSTYLYFKSRMSGKYLIRCNKKQPKDDASFFPNIN